MEINWTTFTAQIVNLLVLVWLLKRFLYTPILQAMDDREQKISERRNAAETARAAAEQEAAALRRQQEELEHAREELLAKAGHEVEAWKKDRLQESRAEVDHARAEWYRAVERDRTAFLRELRLRAGQQVHQLARRVIRKLCRASLERQVIDAFAEELQQLDGNKRREIADAIRNTHHKVLVETAFELSSEDQQQITGLVREHLTDDIECEFKTAPELICGIELKAGGFKVAWSAGETLDELEDEFATALDTAAL